MTIFERNFASNDELRATDDRPRSEAPHTPRAPPPHVCSAEHARTHRLGVARPGPCLFPAASKHAIENGGCSSDPRDGGGGALQNVAVAALPASYGGLHPTREAAARPSPTAPSFISIVVH
jgi:hypothetical protein